MSEELEFAKKLAREAGVVIRENFGLNTDVDWKSDNTPLTETDTRINDMVIAAIKEKFPGHGVIAEEGDLKVDSSINWVCDPIDGTMPFTCGIPTSTFCLSLVQSGEVQLGVIYDPALDRMYSAEKGKGAFLNGDPIRVNAQKEFKSAYIGISSQMPEHTNSAGYMFDKMQEFGAWSMTFKSFAYDSTYVANGKFIAAILGIQYPWDVAATKIIVEEAGGKVTDINGNDREYDELGDGLIASNGLIHDQLVEMLRK